MPDSIGDILPVIKKYAGDSGTCSDEKAIDYINQARRALFNKLQGDGVMEWACVKCTPRDGCWTIPSHYEQIQLAWIGNCPVSLGNQWYESIPQIGVVNSNCFPGRKLIQVGGSHVTFQEYEEGPYLWALQAESNQDVGKEITVFSNDKYDVQQKATVKLGLAPTLVMGPTMTKSVYAITKGETKGRVRLYAVDPNRDNQRLLLAVYQPKDINPSFLRFKIVGNCCQDPLTFYAKKKYQPLVDTNDLLEFSQMAMIHAVTAITYLENRDIGQYTANLSLAVAEINRDMADKEQLVASPLRVFFPDNQYTLTPVWPYAGVGNSAYPFGT